MTEYKFQLVIVPEDYEYNEEEIVYRIYFENQLISERSLPVLKPNQGIVDNFTLLLENTRDIKNLMFENIKNKKAVIEKININEFTFAKNVRGIRTQNLHIKIIKHNK